MAVTTTGRGPRAGRWAAGAALAALACAAATGCGPAGPGGAPPPGHRPAPASPSARASSAAPSPKPSVSAADGHDVGACADGDCQVAVSAPVTFHFRGPGGRAAMAVTEVGPDKVEYRVSARGNSSEGGATGRGQGCITVFRANGGANSCGRVGTRPTRPKPQSGAVVIQVATGADGTALIDMVSP